MNIVDTIKQYAPGIATVLGGPLAGVAVSALAGKLGVEDTLEAVQEAVQKPENRERIIELEQEKFKSVLADKQSARDREIKIANSGASWMSKNIVPLLAVIVVVAWVGIQYTMINIEIQQGMRELVARVLGTLDGALMLVLAYFFGASTKE